MILGLLPTILVSVLNFKIYLAIVKSNKQEVKLDEKAKMMRKNRSLSKPKERYSFTVIKSGTVSTLEESKNMNGLIRVEVSILKDTENETSASNDSRINNSSAGFWKRKQEKAQLLILFSIVILFLICNMPRIILLIHQVTILDGIK